MRRFVLTQADSERRYEEVETVVIPPELASAYADQYHTEELGIDYVIEAAETVLWLSASR